MSCSLPKEKSLSSRMADAIRAGWRRELESKSLPTSTEAVAWAVLEQCLKEGTKAMVDGCVIAAITGGSAMYLHWPASDVYVRIEVPYGKAICFVYTCTRGHWFPYHDAREVWDHIRPHLH